MMNHKKFALLGIVLLAFFCSPQILCSVSAGDAAHFDKRKLLKGCGSCHVGHGTAGKTMLRLEREQDIVCFRCHGTNMSADRERMHGRLSRNIRLVDIEKEFNKPYRHPVEKTGIHRQGETLPERYRSAERHSECVDCHHHHYASKTDTLSGIKGVTAQGLATQKVDSEYELCFKCHSSSANLPGDEKNKADQFKSSNPSYHPVVARGKNNDVPSLIFPLTASSLIKCTDCHNNDDPGGPKGPHGSAYRYILKKNFMDTDGSEGLYQYELCYSCHRRESILANESFFYHDLHISVVGASCKTCHDPHGSSQNAHLIEFDTMTVSPSSKGFIEYRRLGRRSGECYLQCHNKDHSPMSYPTKNMNSAPSSARSVRR